MNIYLDIDGTLLHEELGDRYGQAAAGLGDFIRALRPHQTYWLTTHCRDGNPERARALVKRLLPLELHSDVDRIKPTVWDDLKTEGIDFTQDFIWFDNDIYEGEWERLKHCSENQVVIEVDLRNNPQQLIEITRDILNS